jgi:hypothetical protein
MNRRLSIRCFEALASLSEGAVYQGIPFVGLLDEFRWSTGALSVNEFLNYQE